MAGGASAANVRVQGVVTFADPAGDICYIEDSSGGLRIRLAAGQAVAEIGKVATVSGKMERGSHGIFLSAHEFAAEQEGVTPAIRVNAADLERYAERRVTIEASVEGVSSVRLGLDELALRVEDRRYVAKLVRRNDFDTDSLTGSGVRITGVAVPRATGDGNSFELWVSGSHGVVVERPPVRSGNGEDKSSRLVMRSALAIHRMAPRVAALHLPVDLQAVVTYSNVAGQLFVQDGTDGIFVQSAQGGSTQFEAGDKVIVRGVTAPGDFAPTIGRAKIEKIGTAPLPNPDPDIESAFAGLKDSRWVRLQGVVQDAKENVHSVISTVVWGKHRFQVTFKMAPERVRDMIDREVTLFGACGSLFNDQRQVLGIQLFVPGPKFAQVTPDTTPDPFHRSVRAANTLLQFRPNEDTAHRVHLQGVVTFANATGPTWIRDGSGGLDIESHNQIALQEGDFVDAAGFAEAGNFGPVLKFAEVRKLRGGPTPKPIAVTLAEAKHGESEAQLIQVDGMLVDTFVHEGTRTFRLESDGDVFTAEIPESVPVPSVRSRSKLRLTGICSIATDHWEGFSVAHGFRLTLRSTYDVVVLENGIWFTPERFLITVAASVAIAVLALFWVASLRRNVRRKTLSLDHALQRAREAEALEQSRRSLFELVANNDPIERVMEELVRAAERHSTNARCGVRIDLADVPAITVPKNAPEMRFSVSRMTNRLPVPIEVGGFMAGFILLESTDDSPLSETDRALFPTWGRFASVAIERWAFYENLQFRAQYDALTGLHNRASLQERLRQELAAAARTGDTLAVVYVDLNDFKAVNDTHGHDAGDAVLLEVAERISRSVRRSDVVARPGGDEFVVLLSKIAGAEEAVRIGSLLSSVLSEPFKRNGHELSCAGSIGIAVYPEDGESAQALIKMADHRMYADKAARKSAGTTSRM